MTYRSPLSDRRTFLELLLCEDLHFLSAHLGVSAQALSRLRWSELQRVQRVVGGLPAEDQILDREVFEAHRQAG
jgi:hypothetical protein